MANQIHSTAEFTDALQKAKGALLELDNVARQMLVSSGRIAGLASCRTLTVLFRGTISTAVRAIIALESKVYEE